VRAWNACGKQKRGLQSRSTKKNVSVTRTHKWHHHPHPTPPPHPETTTGEVPYFKTTWQLRLPPRQPHLQRTQLLAQPQGSFLLARERKAARWTPSVGPCEESPCRLRNILVDAAKFGTQFHEHRRDQKRPNRNPITKRKTQHRWSPSLLFPSAHVRSRI